MFTEASFGDDNKTTNLVSPCFDLSATPNPQFSFNYHMFGGGMGDLFLELSTDDGVSYIHPLWSQLGSVQTSELDSWLQIDIDLTSFSGQTVKIRFRGETGSTYSSDMAIDNVSLDNNLCSSTVSIFPYRDL